MTHFNTDKFLPFVIGTNEKTSHMWEGQAWMYAEAELLCCHSLFLDSCLAQIVFYWNLAHGVACPASLFPMCNCMNNSKCELSKSRHCKNLKVSGQVVLM